MAATLESSRATGTVFQVPIKILRKHLHIDWDIFLPASEYWQYAHVSNMG
jgi:hypothetical protein